VLALRWWWTNRNLGLNDLPWFDPEEHDAAPLAGPERSGTGS